ncbi:MAG TPA: DUF748 domain-containing protein, partial [Candidatus Eisenbacteria bacterium]|nr:DUF748 domain-containing protein [Candidatus Eisenbacteria bacterium]
MTPKLKTILLSLGVALVVYALAGFLLAPRLVRSILLENLGKTLTTTPTLEAVRVNPFALSLTLRGFAIPEPGGKSGVPPAVAFDELHLRASILSPFYRAWTLDELRLEKPSVNAAILEDRTLSLFRLLREQPASGDSTSGEPPAVLVRQLRIADGSLAFEDRSRKQPLRKSLIPIQIELRDFTTRKDRENGYSFLARTERQEELEWRGSFTMRPFTSEGTLRVGNLQALTLEDFLGPENPYQFTAGTIDFAAKYKVDASRAPVKTGLHDMAVTIRGLAMTHRETGEEAISAASIQTRGGAVDALALQANLGQVVANGARIRLWMDESGKTNLQRWSRPPADSAAPSWITLIPRLEATGAELTFQERRIDPPVEIHVHGARVEMDGYSTKYGTVSPLSVACSLGTSGWAEAQGHFTSGTAATDLEVAMRDLDVRDLEGYIAPFSRIDLIRGTVGARGRFLWNSLGPGGPMLRFKGEVSSARFASLDGRHKKELLSWDRLEVKELEYDYAPSRVRIREIATVKPYIRFIIAPDMTTNLQGLQVPPDSLPVAFRPTSAPRDTMPVEIGVLKVQDGSMYFADLSLTPNFGTGIVGMNGTIRELSSAQAAHAAIDLTGKVD